MRRMRVLVVVVGALVGLLALGAVQASATTTRVTCPPDDGTALQDAIDNASPGDTIKIRGECVGQFVVNANQRLRLVGHGRGATLNGDQAGSVLFVPVGAALVVKGLNITNGNASRGGGINNSGTLRVIGSSITGNNADIGGGGINNTSTGTARIIGNSITNNTAGVGGGGINNNGTARIIGNSITGNKADVGGGGINNNGTAKVIGSSITGNTAGVAGGGINNNDTTVIFLSRVSGGINNNGTIKIKFSYVSN